VSSLLTSSFELSVNSVASSPSSYQVITIMSTTTVQPNDFVVIKRIFDDGYRLIRADPEG
jgi:hypothetical protein